MQIINLIFLASLFCNAIIQNSNFPRKLRVATILSYVANPPEPDSQAALSRALRSKPDLHLPLSAIPVSDKSLRLLLREVDRR